MKKAILVIASLLLFPIIVSTLQFMFGGSIIYGIKIGLGADVVFAIILIFIRIVFWATGAKQKMDDLL